VAQTLLGRQRQQSNVTAKVPSMRSWFVRAGGAPSDMTAFDGPDIAQAIVQASVPVVLAVGHATDFHTADLFAHTSLPTPSAAAD
jgi:exonuclease VII large subunit